MTNEQNNNRLHSDRNQTEDARDIGSEKWIQAKRDEFENDIEQHNVREKQITKMQALFSFEVTIAISCAGAATLLTLLRAPEVMDEADIIYFRGIGLTSIVLLVLVVISRLWRKRIQRKLDAQNPIDPKG